MEPVLRNSLSLGSALQLGRYAHTERLESGVEQQALDFPYSRVLRRVATV